MSVQTIRDIAEIAGVSVATVSRVMNNKPDVNPATREKVEAVIRDHHFVGNSSARELKQNDRSVIAIVIHGKSNPFLYNLSEKILSMTDSLPCSTITEYVDEKDDELEAARRLVHQKDLKGLILIGGHPDPLTEPVSELNIPIVFATVPVREASFPYASSVCIDDRAMASEAIRVLLDHGHRNIAVFGAGSSGSGAFSARYRGISDGFENAGIPFNSDMFCECRFSVKDGYQTAMSFFRLHPGTTALFAMSDSIAIGAMRALTDLGLNVPRDISVIGFDGVDMCNYTVPRLSTVIQPVDRIASESVSIMSEMISNHIAPRHVILDAEISISESVMKKE